MEMCMDNLSEAEFTFLETMLAGLPPVIARRDVRKLTGGLISYQTLSNVDFCGIGPPSFRVGRMVFYPTRPFLVWIVKTYGINPPAFEVKHKKGEPK